MADNYRDDAAERFKKSAWEGRESKVAEQSFFVADDQDTWLGLWLIYVGKQPPLEELPEGYFAVSYFLNPQDAPGSEIKFEDRAQQKKIGGEEKIVLEFTITEPDKPQKATEDTKSAWAVKLIPETDLAITLLCRHRGKVEKKPAPTVKRRSAKTPEKKPRAKGQ